MTAASISLVPAQRASRWQLALALLGVCLPVPVFAATGLSLPLPSAIERLAISLVPWEHPSALDANQALARGAAGTIPLDAEQAIQVSVGEDGTLVVVRTPRHRATRPGPIVDDRVTAAAPLPFGYTVPPVDRRGGTTPGAADGPSAAAPVVPGSSAAVEQPAPAQEAPAQAPAPAPAPAPAQTTEPAPGPSAPAPSTPAPAPVPVVAPVVEDVVDTVDDTVGVVDEVVDDVVAPVLEPVAPLPPLLPGLGK